MHATGFVCIYEDVEVEQSFSAIFWASLGPTGMVHKGSKLIKLSRTWSAELGTLNRHGRFWILNKTNTHTRAHTSLKHSVKFPRIAHFVEQGQKLTHTRREYGHPDQYVKNQKDFCSAEWTESNRSKRCLVCIFRRISSWLQSLPACDPLNDIFIAAEPRKSVLCQSAYTI